MTMPEGEGLRRAVSDARRASRRPRLACLRAQNITFMESVWWVFGQLHAKGLVYRGFKVMPYSCACNTPLSNFEVQQNYKVCHACSAAARIPGARTGRAHRARAQPRGPFCGSASPSLE